MELRFRPTSPSVMESGNWKTVSGETLPDEVASLGFGRALVVGRVDRVANLRQDWSAGLSNGPCFDPARGEFGADPGASFVRYCRLLDWFGPEFRVYRP